MYHVGVILIVDVLYVYQLLTKLKKKRTFCQKCTPAHDQEKRQFYPAVDAYLREAGL